MRSIQTRLTHVLDSICSHHYSDFFMHPYEGDQHYDSIIATKMDLTTIREKLEEGYYKSVQEFYFDLNIIWKNCQYYNQEDSQIYKQSVYLEKLSNSMRLQIEKDLQIERNKQKKHQKQLQEIQKKQISKKTKKDKFLVLNDGFDYKFKKKAADGLQKIKLCSQIGKMNEEQLMQTLNLIAEQCPEALEGNGKDIQINTKKLDCNSCEQIDRQFDKTINQFKKKK